MGKNPKKRDRDVCAQEVCDLPETNTYINHTSTEEKKERKRNPREPPSLVACEDSEKRWHLWTSKHISHQLPDLLVPWSWTSQPLELWEIKTYCYKSLSLQYFCYSSLNKLRQGWKQEFCESSFMFSVYSQRLYVFPSPVVLQMAWPVPLH